MAQTQIVRGVHTRIFAEDGFTVVRLYNTDVVRFNEHVIVLNSDGYRTVTTKLRMNQASNQFNLGYCVFQKQHEWFVQLENGIVTPFEDGIQIQRFASGGARAFLEGSVSV